jgi:hypothetical protein
MIPNRMKKYFELNDRSCDALVLAYNLENRLEKGLSFYIPRSSEVEEAFGVALRKIFGTKEGSCHWADSVNWALVRELNSLDKRIHNGVFEVVSGDSDYQTIFEGYLSSSGGKFDSTWIYLKGDLYRFKEGKRKEALLKFENFWDEREKSRWKEIHKLMREYTQRQYEVKSGMH